MTEEASMPALRALAADGSFAAPGCRLAAGHCLFSGPTGTWGNEHSGYRPFASPETDSALGYTSVLALRLRRSGEGQSASGLTALDDRRAHVAGVVRCLISSSFSMTVRPAGSTTIVQPRSSRRSR
jgi:hypothetical protein